MRMRNNTYILYSSCEILFPAWTPDNISSLKSVVQFIYELLKLIADTTVEASVEVSQFFHGFK